MTNEYNQGYNRGVADSMIFLQSQLCTICSDREIRQIINSFKEHFNESNDEESDFVIISCDSDFFDIPMSDYKHIVGKTFKCKEIGEVMKVTGLPDLSKRDICEFLYEIYWKSSYDEKWHLQNYIWLQEHAYGNFCERFGNEYKSYCLTAETEMNIKSESMFRLGKDGNLYKTYDYDQHYRFTECSNEDFNIARNEAINNFGEYIPISYYRK